MSTTTELVSVGYLSQMLQRSPNAIGQAALAIGIPPALLLNGVPHFDSGQVAQLTEHFRTSAGTWPAAGPTGRSANISAPVGQAQPPESQR